MRYEDWDVILFPESSKVPIQEFKTQCFVTKDKDSPYLHSPGLVSPATCPLPQSNEGQLPVLTTFVPSLRHNTPFRVSVHSWQKPTPSRLMESLLQPDDAVLFEVRVFIDGLCVSGSVFHQRSGWPHVIDLSSYVDKTGNQDSLRFPPFHQEILEQRHWDAAELYGRIRVVIAEGFCRPHRYPPFERVKEIVAFAFQHAPLQVLEHSNIAWPNPSMWTREPRLFKYNSGIDPANLTAEDSHAHSPSKQGAQGRMLAPRSQMPLPQWQGQCMPDPFTDPVIRHRGARSSCEDVPMPDYISSSGSSRAISSMTGISYEHSKHPSIVTPVDEESYRQLIEALSPPKPLALFGIAAPTNSPSTALPMGNKLSAAAEARSAPYTKGSSRTSILKEISLPGTREASGSSTKSTAASEATAEGAATTKIHATPSPRVKSRKEGMSQAKVNESLGGSPLKVNEKPRESPSKLVVRTSGGVESPTRSSRKSSTGSARAEVSPIS
ncbi:similar to An12g00400 [Aspergillus niger]|uniref:Similar to An12g00400 n=1 Tax=Aspergillus niger TaxID=5061 RepID=A0A117E301_ASPNG|nr:similar to An12g00400 [Aspergillus niger]